MQLTCLSLTYGKTCNTFESVLINRSVVWPTGPFIDRLPWEIQQDDE